MPIDQAEAIVLRTMPIGDQDKIAALLTRDKGLIRGVAKGARKFGNRFGSALEPMSHVTAFYYEKERRELVTISACDLIESFFEVQADTKTALTLAYFSELIEEFLPMRAREDIIFRLLLSVLQALKGRCDLAVLSRYFEAWFLQVNGYLPDLRRCRGCRKALEGPGWLAPKRDGVYCDACAPSRKDEVHPDLGRFVLWARKSPPSQAGECPCSPADLRSIRKGLQAMIIYHLEREPKSLRYIKD